MKPVVKGYLIGCSVLLVLGVVGAIAVIRFIDQRSTEFFARGQAVREEGARFGQNVGESKCVEEAIARYRRRTGFVSGVEYPLWLGGCLDTSAFEVGFCDGVPPEDELVRA